MPDRVEPLDGRAQRQSGLRGRLLDPDEDPVLQKLAAEAASELSTHSATVSLLFEKKQLLKGTFNPGTEERVVDRDRGMCRFVIEDQQPVEVNDARSDPRALPEG